MDLAKIQQKLYGTSTLEEALRVEERLKAKQPRAGVCPNQWRAQEIAFRCLDCELDNNCVQCADCFYKAKHEGHEVLLIRTVGGSCDCGDPSSWNPDGFCPEHCETPPRLDSPEALDLLPPELLARAQEVLPELLAEVDRLVEAKEDPEEVLEVLQRLGEVIGLRFLVTELLAGERLERWIFSSLPESMERFFLLYVQVSPRFKKRFAKVFGQQYLRINEEVPDLLSLSVQLFTIPEVACDLLREGLLSSLLNAIKGTVQGLVEVKEGLKVVKSLNRDWDVLFRSLHDLSYLLHHEAVCAYVLEALELQEAIVEIFGCLWRVRVQKRETRQHVLYEVRHSEGFLLEGELLKSFKSFSDYCRRPDATMQELTLWYGTLSRGLQALDFGTFNSSDGSSFHMPLLRLWTACLHWELLQDAGLELKDIFPASLLAAALGHAVRTLRFEAEIQSGWWVRNGQSMHLQQAEYRLRFRQLDVMTLQACMMLMKLHDGVEVLGHLWSAALDESAVPLSTAVLDAWRRLWAEEVTTVVQLRFRLFWSCLAQGLNEMLPIEVSLCRRHWETRYQRCGVILQRFLIQVLAKPMSLAELTPLLPKDLQVRENQLLEALEQVAERSELRFQLKKRSWIYFDCCMAEALPMRHSRELQHDAEEAALQQQVSLLGPKRSDGLTLGARIQDHLVDALRTSELIPLVVEFIQCQCLAKDTAGEAFRRHPAQSEDAFLYCLKVLDIISDAQIPHLGGASALASQLCAAAG